mmetsp:Transcript_17686/g.52387  ORF Transcript_17686/g.52387 Transcript_17686/m.52387 type:complete len:200 (-) Transcript_17686:58-657(-)
MRETFEGYGFDSDSESLKDLGSLFGLDSIDAGAMSDGTLSSPTRQRPGKGVKKPHPLREVIGRPKNVILLGDEADGGQWHDGVPGARKGRDSDFNPAELKRRAYVPFSRRSDMFDTTSFCRHTAEPMLSPELPRETVRLGAVGASQSGAVLARQYSVEANATRKSENTGIPVEELLHEANDETSPTPTLDGAAGVEREV